MTQKAAGDFPTVLLEVVQKRSSVMKGTMRVDQVNACLDDLAACSGKVYVATSYGIILGCSPF